MKNAFYYVKRAQYAIERLSGRKVFVFQSAKHGIEDVLDLGRWIAPGEAILDVGANVGQTAIRFRAAFPSARIISFEPVAATYAELKRNTQGLDVETHRLALGPAAGMTTIFLTPLSLTNSLVRPPEGELRGSEEVEVTTLDQFVCDNAIGPVGLLKIDAEGFDLEVIRGAAGTLASGAVRFVMAEVGFDSRDSRHPLFDDVRDALARFGFRVFGIYGQTPEWTGEPALRFANAIFCRDMKQAPAVE